MCDHNLGLGRCIGGLGDGLRKGSCVIVHNCRRYSGRVVLLWMFVLLVLVFLMVMVVLVVLMVVIAGLLGVCWRPGFLELAGSPPSIRICPPTVDMKGDVAFKCKRYDRSVPVGVEHVALLRLVGLCLRRPVVGVGGLLYDLVLRWAPVGLGCISSVMSCVHVTFFYDD